MDPELCLLYTNGSQVVLEEISVQDSLLNAYNLSSANKEIFYKILRNALESKDFRSFEIAIKYRKDPDVLHVNYVLYSDSEETCLDRASKNGLTEFVKLLLQNGAEPNRINEVYNCAPIHFATKGGHEDTLAVLLEAPTINPNLEAGQNTALHFAVRKNNLVCAELLLKNGASASIPNSKGVTALHLAAMNGQSQMVKVILINSQSFIDIDTYKDYNDQTTRDVIRQNLPDIPLPKRKNREVNAQDLKYFLLTNNEMSFLFNMDSMDFTEILPNEVEQLLEIAVAHNFDKAVIRILEKFKRKFSAEKYKESIKKAAEVAVLQSHNTILWELLRLEPKIANDLLLRVCQQLGIPERRKDNNTSDRLKCLKLILEQKNVNVRCKDEKDNTPLHYAVRARCAEAVTLLLKRGSYIGHLNKFNVPPIAHIPTCILLRYFDECLQIRKGCTKEYIVEFDYRCLMPHDILKEHDENHRTTREMEVFQYITSNSNLKQLLKHPVLSSFLYLKWHNIRHILHANFAFYVLFYILLNTYIWSSNNIMNQSKTVQIVSDSFNITLKNPLQIVCNHQNNSLQIFIIPLLLLFTFWEILRFIFCPWRTYLMNLENLLIIGLTIILINDMIQVGSILILLSTWKLIMLISQYKDMAISFEMFRKVSINYVCLFFPYILFIFAFALAFHTLFRDIQDIQEKDFSNLTSSIFKTLIMLTGELDAGNIPFHKNFIWSHIVFILFLFLITIVLLNLLNGLAVSNTAEVLSEAELIGMISLIHIVVYIENMAMGKLCNHICCKYSTLRWNLFGFLIKRIFLFPHKMRYGKINVKQYGSVNDEYAFIAKDYDRKESANRDEYWTISKMDSNIMKNAKQILNKNQLSDINNEKIMSELIKLQEQVTNLNISRNLDLKTRN